MNIVSGGIAGPSLARSSMSRSIVVPDRSLPTMKNGGRVAVEPGRSLASAA
jgi:hypothetical protein